LDGSFARVSDDGKAAVGSVTWEGVARRRALSQELWFMAMLTPKEVAERLRISTTLVYSLCAAGKLKHYRFGLGNRKGGLRVDEQDLEEYKEQCRQHVIIVEETTRTRRIEPKEGGFRLLRAAGWVPKGEIVINTPKRKKNKK
jgi:excisionase family DNA binding protein